MRGIIPTRKRKKQKTEMSGNLKSKVSWKRKEGKTKDP